MQSENRTIERNDKKRIIIIIVSSTFDFPTYTNADSEIKESCNIIVISVNTYILNL